MSAMPIPVLDQERCDGCGLCAQACSDGVLQIIAGLPRLVSDSECAYCGSCEEACPRGAIALIYEIVMGND